LKEALEGRRDRRIRSQARVPGDRRSPTSRGPLHRWFSVVYRNPDGADASGVHGTPEQVRGGWSIS
jgi:hypothetical protein